MTVWYCWKSFSKLKYDKRKTFIIISYNIWLTWWVSYKRQYTSYHSRALEFTHGCFWCGSVFLTFFCVLCCPIMCLYLLSSVLWCPIRFPHTTMFGSSSHPVVCMRALVSLFFCVCLCIVMSNILLLLIFLVFCIVFFSLFVFVLCLACDFFICQFMSHYLIIEHLYTVSYHK